MQDSNKKSRKHGFNTYSVFLMRKSFKEFDVYMNDAFCTNLSDCFIFSEMEL